MRGYFLICAMENPNLIQMMYSITVLLECKFAAIVILQSCVKIKKARLRQEPSVLGGSVIHPGALAAVTDCG